MSKKKYDVGIFGVWYGCNYGSIATYYGLNRVIESLGYSVLMIDKPNLGNAKDEEMGDTHSRRFGKEHYHISERYSLEHLKELNEQCETFVLGSDQVWNYGISKYFGKSNYLDFAGEKHKKIAYAASFGHAVDFTPEKEREEVGKLLRRFDAISIRESQGIDMARENYHVRATHVVDPVFLADKSIYEELADKSKICEEIPYICTYILDPTAEIREALLHISEKKGLRLINVLDGVPWIFGRNKRRLGLEVVPNVEVEDWLYLIKNSELLITDSCHGMAMAAIFEKTVIPIANRQRGYARFESLVEMIGIPERLIKHPREMIDNPACLEPMNVEFISLLLESNRISSREWLRTALETPAPRLPTVAIPQKAVTQKLEQSLCMACSACINTCSQEALAFQEDVWGYYRSHVNYDRCVDCGHCEVVCPALHLPHKTNEENPTCYATIATDGKILNDSSSGGMFTLLAERIFQLNGFVVGATWTETFAVKHVIIKGTSELSKLQKSKYLQSYLGDVFKEIKEKLEQNFPLLFTGTPCQVAGLKAYLGKEYEHLLLVDILCSHAPSQLFFRKYLREAFPQGVKKYEFRHKKYGWDCITIKVTTMDGETIIRRGAGEDDWQRIFHDHTMCAIHCETCKYQKIPRYGDLTLGDFWGIEKRDQEMDTKQGVSVVLCNNDKGRAFLESIPGECLKLKKEVPLQWLGGNGYAINNSKNYSSPKRDIFYREIQTKSFSKAVRKTLEE